MIPFFFILAALKFSEFAQTCFRLRRALRDRGGSEGGGALCRVGPLALTHTHVPVEERGKFCWELSRPPFGFPSGFIFALRFSWCFRLTLLNFLKLLLSFLFEYIPVGGFRWETLRDPVFGFDEDEEHDSRTSRSRRRSKTVGGSRFLCCLHAWMYARR